MAPYNRKPATSAGSALAELAGAMVGMAHAAAAPAAPDGKLLFAELEEGRWQHTRTPIALDGSALKNEGGETFLVVASRNGTVDIVRQLLLDHADVDDTDSEGWNALLVAAYHGHIEVVRALIAANATVDHPDLMGWTPLMWAVYKNHPECVQLLIASGAHVNLIDEEDGLTPLIVSSGRGFTDIVRMLIEASAQVNSMDKFGSTALIWASRKGHLPAVQLLLNAGAEVDVQGMHQCTALMLATKGNYVDVVDALLAREPNTNAVDNNGLSALGIAAREGYAAICEALVNSGAFVNQSDRYGNCILASAVRSGNANIVRLLLEKFADVNSKDSDGRTSLHLAIDKSFMDIVLILLEKRPNLEMRNRDGETPLLRAVKSRHVALCQLLVNAGAKIAATDNNGDNALHLALRARSRRLTQTLLVNPSDSRLLYRPNKLGQTPYSIDQMNPQPILPHIFGPIDAENQMESLLGYDVYSNVLADMVCEPSLSLPLTIGLYAKWGSGKSLLLAKLKESMSSFSRSWKDSIRLRWSWRSVVYIFIVVALLTLPIATIASIPASKSLLISVFAVGFAVFLLIVFIYGIVYYGSEEKGWSTSQAAAAKIALIKAKVLLLFNMLTSYAPMNNGDKDSVSNPVSFLFADYHRLSSIGGEQALAKIVSTLFEAAEAHYGVLAVRLFCAFHSTRAMEGSGGSRSGESGSKLRLFCGVPIFLTAFLILVTGIAGQILLMKWLFEDDRGDLSHTGGFLISCCVCFLLFFILSIYPVGLALVHSVTNIPRRRVNAAAHAVHKLRFEGFMQRLQTEVELLADMVHSLDAFTSSQTRLVVVVDGLDNCEQERMVSTLDALELLFSARKNRPFIVVLAMDPHIIISALNHNMHSALLGTELTGHDYLKNIVNMPFYLHNSALRQLQLQLKEKRESMADWRERFRRQDTFHGSHLSLRDADGGGGGAAVGGRSLSRRLTMVVGTRSLNESLLSDDYFSNLNPRAVRRIVNAVALTARLMRAFEVDFTWASLGHWVSLTEQWPSRMCWLMEQALDCPNPVITLVDIYRQVKDRISKTDDLIGLDRNVENFEAFLETPNMPAAEQLTVGHVRRFVPCTSNIDPYLRKQIRERRAAQGDPLFFKASCLAASAVLPPNAQHLFSDDAAWESIEVPLVEMRIDDFASLVRRLDIPSHRIDDIIRKLYELNLNGLVLSTCSMDELRTSLQVSLGDWTLIHLLIDTLRAFGKNVPGGVVAAEGGSGGGGSSGSSMGMPSVAPAKMLQRKKSGKALVKKSLSLREEEEDEFEHADISEVAIEVEHQQRRSVGGLESPTPAINIVESRNRRSTISENVDSEHGWLMQSLCGLDQEAAAIDAHSHSRQKTSSVRFDDQSLLSGEAASNHDDDDATSMDSTESRFGSRENLLDHDSPPEDGVIVPASATVLPGVSGGQRSELLRRVRGISVHSEGGGGADGLNDVLSGGGTASTGERGHQSSHETDEGDVEAQLTVHRRDGEQQAQPSHSLAQLFQPPS